MSGLLPEKPLLFYPSLARRFGSDEALLFFCICERLQGEESLCLTSPQWRQLTDFWPEARQWRAAESLQQQGVLRLNRTLSGDVSLQLLPQSDVSSSVRPASTLPVYEQPPAVAEPLRAHPSVPDASLVQRRGPAPTFGPQAGWRRHKDELERVFEEREETHQRMVAMHLGWQPSEMFHELLPRHGIPADFASQCLDEFILYWLDKDKRESNWDQKFLAWVKRDWVKKQAQDAREQRYEQQGAGQQHEQQIHRQDTREKRKRVTAAIMDIRDTDW